MPRLPLDLDRLQTLVDQGDAAYETPGFVAAVQKAPLPTSRLELERYDGPVLVAMLEGLVPAAEWETDGSAEDLAFLREQLSLALELPENPLQGRALVFTILALEKYADGQALSKTEKATLRRHLPASLARSMFGKAADPGFWYGEAEAELHKRAGENAYILHRAVALAGVWRVEGPVLVGGKERWTVEDDNGPHPQLRPFPSRAAAEHFALEANMAEAGYR